MRFERGRAEVLRAYVMTRGLVRDYAFLGDEPPRAFWMAFRDATSFERPSFALLSDPTGIRLFAGGVASGRRDRVGTRIRFSVVLEADDHREAELVTKLAAAWLAELDGPGPLARALDAALPEPLVEEALADRQGPSAKGVAPRLLEALGSLPEPTAAAPGVSFPSWLAPAGSPLARGAFLARVAKLARGEEPGAALCLNLAETAAEAERALGPAPRGVVLLSALPLAGEIAPLEKKAAAPAPRKPRTRRAAIAIAIVVLNLAAGLLLLRPW